MELDKHLLNDIVRPVSPAKQPVGEPTESSGVASDEVIERRLIAALKPREQLLVGFLQIVCSRVTAGSISLLAEFRQRRGSCPV
jgi:hypothetical protein